jgi:hypothetical protein
MQHNRDVTARVLSAGAARRSTSRCLGAVMGRHQVPWLNASTAAASNLEELAYHYGTDKSHDDHKCVHLHPHNRSSAHTLLHR